MGVLSTFNCPDAFEFLRSFFVLVEKSFLDLKIVVSRCITDRISNWGTGTMVLSNDFVF